MAALTPAQWYAKICKWVPSTFFLDQGGTQTESEELTQAVFQSLAAVFAQCNQDMEDQQGATFILDAAAPILDLHGDERSYPRPAGDSDGQYAPLIQNSLFLGVDIDQIEAVVNACLTAPPAFFIDNRQYGFFDDPDTSETEGFPYFDDYWTRWIDMTKWYNWWTVIIPAQTEAQDPVIQAALITAIERNIALGTTYDILYETNYLLGDGGGYLLDDSGSRLALDDGNAVLNG